MHDKKYNDAKKEIRSVLLTFQGSVSLSDFLKSYKGLLGENLPSGTCGFRSDLDFLKSMPDVVDIKKDSCGKVYLTGIADESSQHIKKLVSRQRKPNKSNNKLNKRQPLRKLPDTSYNVKSLPPFLSGTLRAEFLQLMANYRGGITFAAFALAYHRKYNKYLSLVKGFDTLEGMIKLIPELEVRIENSERMIYPRKSTIGVTSIETDNNEKCASSPEQGKGNKSAILPEKQWFDIHKSGIADDILQDFKTVLERYPDGILDIHFPPLYENATGKLFDLHELGYSSMAELVDMLPHIFRRKVNPNDERQWIILPAKGLIRHGTKDEKTSSSQKTQTPQKLREGIPADASSPSLQYIEPTIPHNLDLNEYIPIFVSSIVNPSLFWFQLQTDEAIDKFQKFEKDMGYFYNYVANRKYHMQNVDIAIGATCVIQCPDDNLWYRAVIKAIPNTDSVNVLFLDYGSRENIPKKNLYYVRSKYHEFPACAFKAELAHLKPPGNASAWNIQSQRRFIQLCDCAVLMAHIIAFDRDTHSVNLCDTSGEEDIYINDTLVNEGYAVVCLESQLHINNNISPNESETIFNGDGTHIDSESGFSSKSDQCTSALQSDDSEINSESKVLPTNRKLSFSSKELCDDKEPNISQIEKRQNSKRYVKLVEHYEESKFHIINLEDHPFISSGDLCRLLWKEKNSCFLSEMLLYKEVQIPFLEIKKEDCEELFTQCVWFQIPDIEDIDSSKPSLIVYPLEKAINVLNIFGHPSLSLRLIIQHEIKHFDPHDPTWKEFSHAESFNVDEIEKDMQQKLSKLCIYDLKAKYEALKIKRLKLLRLSSDSSSVEINRIENLQHAIEIRIKQIDAICKQFSS